MIRFVWTVGPIPVDDHIGKEIVSLFHLPTIKNNATWYTDSNGREFQKRIRNYRATYQWQPTEPTAGNFFPAPVMAIMNDTEQAFVINVDRSERSRSFP